ncbi:MAG: YfhO family protein [Clostridiales bacterium]|nr:YfhO family protein [Clostridiales bacterium]
MSNNDNNDNIKDSEAVMPQETPDAENTANAAAAAETDTDTTAAAAAKTETEADVPGSETAANDGDEPTTGDINEPADGDGSEDAVSDGNDNSKAKKPRKKLTAPKWLKRFGAFLGGVPGVCARAFERHDRLHLLFCFLTPALLTWIMYIFMGCFPFGSNSVLVLDLNGQYVSFFEYLRTCILNGDSLAYSWERALGGEFMGIYDYYLASPFSLLVAFFPKRFITEALLLMFLLKAGFVGFGMGVYLDIKFRTPATPQSRKLNIVLFSTLYATCAYMVVMGHNTMWVDELAILPFLCLGIERVIRREDFVLYVSSLALAIIANFYIGYMMCIFTFFCFIASYFSMSPAERNPTGIRFHLPKTIALAVIYTAVAVSIAGLTVLSAYYALHFGKTTFSDPDFSIRQTFKFLDLIVKLLPSYDTVRPEGLPWVYCGTLTVILAPLYFLLPNKVVPAREKICGGLMLSLFVFSFNLTPVDMVWHGFQAPNWLNHRYSFMFCFFLLVFGYRTLDALLDGRLSKKAPIITGGILLLLVFIIQKFEYEFFDEKGVWSSIGCIALCLFVLGILLSVGLKRSTGILLTAAICVEAVTIGVFGMVALDKDVVFTSRASYRSYMDRIEPFIDSITAEDDSFYRLEKSFHRKTNDPMAIGYKGTSNSTSTLNAPAIRLLNRLGYASISHWSKHLGGTPVSDSLLGLKYLIFEEELEDNKFYELIKSDEGEELYAYLNPHALSAVTAVNPAMADFDIEEYNTPFELMNAFVTEMLGEEKTVEIFKKIRTKDSDYDNIDIGYVVGHKKYSPELKTRAGKMLYTIEGVGKEYEIFMALPTDYPRECSVMINGSDYGRILGNETACIKSLGRWEKGEEMLISISIEENEVYIANSGSFFWYLDEEVFNEYMPRLKSGCMDITEWSQTRLYGTLDAGETNTYLFMTIPFDEGWQIYVDGERVAENLVCANALMGCHIPAGKHTVEMKYMPNALKYGLIASAAGFVSYLVLLTDETGLRRLIARSRTRKKAEEEIPGD